MAGEWNSTIESHFTVATAIASEQDTKRDKKRSSTWKASYG